MNPNDIKKELYKSKVNAKFSHYTSGNLYYTVELNDGIYQFPISTVDRIIKIVTGDSSTTYDNEPKNYTLSYDLGTTSFYDEMKGSELNRWILKAIDSKEFIKIN